MAKGKGQRRRSCSVEIKAKMRLAPLVGANVRRLRLAAGADQQTLADAVTTLGLPWDLQRVSRLERGVAASMDVPLLILLAAALDGLPGQGTRVGIANLVQDADREVALTDHLTVPADALAAILGGEPAGRLAEYRPTTKPEPKPLRGRRVGYETVDHRAADALGVDDDTLIEVSQRRWGRLLSGERAERFAQAAAGSGASLRQGVKAAITAQLVEELREELSRLSRHE